MSTKESLILREYAELALAVDDTRDPDDPFKLSPEMRALLELRLANMEAGDAATFLTESDRTVASGKVKSAIENLTQLLHDGYNHVKAIPSISITEAERLGLFTAYGWSQGLIGDLPPDRVESLANQAVAATPTIETVAWRYPDAVMAALTEQLATLNANQVLAKTGTRQQAIADRDTALIQLRQIDSRVRFFYCSASDRLDTTPELARIGRQMRRGGGEAGSAPEEPEGPLPAAPGTATYDEASLALSIPELPSDATTIRAYRQRTDGGEAELAGTSTTTTVSLIGLGPLQEGVEYNAWVVGHNAVGNGPPSNVITLVGPA